MCTRVTITEKKYLRQLSDVGDDPDDFVVTSGDVGVGADGHVGRRRCRIAAAAAALEGRVDTRRGDETGRRLGERAVSRAHGDESLGRRPQGLSGNSVHFPGQPLNDVLDKVKRDDRTHVPLEFGEEQHLPFLKQHCKKSS